MVTLKDLAKELNVSVSTVSKALSDSHEISEKTKERIVKLAKSKNYVANTTAINLRSRKTNTIGVIIPNIFNHFYTKILSGIEKEAKKNGYKIVVAISNESIQSEREGISFFSNGSVDGILLAPSDETEKKQDFKHIDELKQKEIPFVLFDRDIEGFSCDKVLINDFDSSKNTIETLLNFGRENILLVSLLKNLNIGKLRLKGALSIKNDMRIIELESEDGLEERLEKVLSSEKIDAIVALDELSGIISLNVARNLKIEVPKNLSIISFSQGILSKYSYPRLSTINQQAEFMGSKSVNLLIKRIEDLNRNFETKIIETKLEMNQT